MSYLLNYSSFGKWGGIWAKSIEIKYLLKDEDIIYKTCIDKLESIDKPELLSNIYFEDCEMQVMPNLMRFINLNLIGFKNVIFENKKIEFNNYLSSNLNLKKMIFLNTNLHNIFESLNGMNLTYLRLENIDCSNTDSDDINKLTSLEELYIINCKYSNLINVSNLTNIKILQLKNLGLSNIIGLDKLVNMFNLDITYNNINNINDITNLNNLKYLYINNNHIKKLCDCDKLGNLKYLICSNNEIDNFDNILNLENLEVLDIVNNNCKHLPNLLKLNNLNYERLNVNWSKIQTIDGMKGFGLIKNIIMSKNN